MQQALEEQDDGVAIAAPQVGENLRLFVMSRKVFDLVANDKNRAETMDPKAETREFSDMIFINPKVIKLSKEKVDTEEGCLSVRWLYGKVRRSKKATVQALDENGEKILVGGSGLVAQIFQHEIDHLDGILFTDKAKDLQEILPTKSSN
jgi:peptide deformylase